MKCKEAIREISDFLDGHLNPKLKHELEAHFKECDECNLVVVQTKKTIEFFIESEAPELPGEVHTRLHGTLKKRLTTQV